MRQVDPEQMSLFEMGPDMAKIRKIFGELKQATRSKATLAAYGSDWKSFEAWCRSANRESLPATSETIALYVTAKLADDHSLAISTVERHVAAVAFKHRLAGMEKPDRREARAVLDGARRHRKEFPKQRAALSPEQLKKICNLLVRDTAHGSMKAALERAVLTLGFATGLRRSNLVALDLSDVRFVARKGMVVTVRSSKTDQVGKGQTLRVFRGVREATCPVRALQKWLSVRGQEKGPLFVIVSGTRWGGEILNMQRIAGERINQIVKAGLHRIGESRENYGAHSLRAGFVTTAQIEGASPLAIMEYTGHRTVEMVNRYLRPTDVFPSRSPLGRAV